MSKTLKVVVIIFILLVLFIGITLIFKAKEKYDVQNIKETYQMHDDFFEQLDFIVCINSQSGGPVSIDENSWAFTSVKVQENGECYKIVGNYLGNYKTCATDIYKSKLTDKEVEELNIILENTNFELISIESNVRIDSVPDRLRVNFKEKTYGFSMYKGDNSDLDRIYSWVSEIKFEEMIK